MPDVPHIYGDDCLIGFPEGETPKYMYVRFSMLVKCPDPPDQPFTTPPNDRMFKLTQDLVKPCEWRYEGTGWIVGFWYVTPGPDFIVFLEHVPDYRFYFWGRIAPPVDEGEVYNNELVGCAPLQGATGGIAAVTWTQEATNLLKSINMQRADDLFMEMRPLVDGNKVYKFCRLQDATNIAIEFEP